MIELLVVIAIISLLVSILLPSLNRAKDLAMRVVCESNMKQLGLAFMMYTNDNRDYFPVIRKDGPNNITDMWADKLYDTYVHDVKVFHCPGAPSWRIYIPNEENGALDMAYGIEWLIGGMEMDNRAPRKITSIDQPSETVLLGENDGSSHHGYGVWNYPAFLWSLPDDNRHAGVSNILCVGGNVAPFTQDEAIYGGKLIWLQYHDAESEPW